MSLETNVVDLLTDDTVLLATLTGGVYGLSALGKQGLHPQNTLCADAFTLSNGFNILQPCAIVRVRSHTPLSSLYDAPSQTVAMRSVIEIRFHDDDSYTKLYTAQNRVYALLAMTTQSFGAVERDQKGVELRAPDQILNNAALIVDAYAIVRATTN